MFKQIMLAFPLARAYQENEPARCSNTRQALTTRLNEVSEMAIIHVTFFLFGINSKAVNALASSACSSLQ
jgi:hypothetical protein